VTGRPRAAPRTEPMSESGQNASKGPKTWWGDGVGACRRRSGAPPAADSTPEMRFSGSCERGRAGRARHRRTGARGERREARGEGIVRLAEKHGIWVLSDEAYEHVLFDGREHVSAGALGYPKVVSVYSFSKSYAMSGLRLGYVAVGDATLVERMAKLVRCTTNGVNSATQVAAGAAEILGELLSA